MGCEDHHRIHEKTEKIGKLRLIIFGLCVIIAVLFVILCRNFSNGAAEVIDKAGEVISDVVIGREGETATFSEASIKKVFAVSELSTADYTYNAIAKAYEEDGITVKYYVAYEGRVKVGMDFSRIEVELNEEEKVVTITIPEIEFQEKTVDPGTLEFIFKDKKSETERIHQEAFLLCQKDLDQRTDKEEELLTLAQANAKSVVEALVTPWIKQIEQEYTINIQVKGSHR